VNIQGTFRETFREHSVNIQRTFKEQWVNVEGTFSDLEGDVVPGLVPLCRRMQNIPNERL
jgi:hypothetical protein